VNLGSRHKLEDFIWEKSIGKGTFGEVFQVKEKKTGKFYAIKKVFQDPAYSN
jgi:serine/threonine protein kinase